MADRARTRAGRTVAPAAAAAVLLAGCGSTVNLPGTASVAAHGSGGLAAPTTAGGVGGLPADTGTAGPNGTSGAGTAGAPPGGTGGGVAGTAGGATAGMTVAGATTATATIGPLRIGIVLTKVSNAADYGVKIGNTYQEQDIYDALIRAMNKRGGIAGRRIDPVYASTDTATTNWSTDFQAACAKFTQDNHVVAVLGYVFNYDRSFESCLARFAIPHLTTTFNVPDTNELRRYPLFWDLEVPTINERSVAKLEGAINTGVLTPANRLGVVVDDCPGTQSAWRNVVVPFLGAHHITVAATTDEGCPTGNNQTQSNAVAQAGNAMLQFRSEGVDRVTFISVSEGPPLLVLSEAAESQHYYPQWIVSSLANLSTQQGQAPNDQMANVHGYGWLPTQDVGPSLYPPANATQRRCLTLLASQGVQPVSAADFGFAYNMCESLFVYQLALQRTNGNSLSSAAIQAVGQIGTRYESVLNYDGASTFAPARRNNVPRVYRQVVWKKACTCFVYTGSTYAMP